MTILHITDIYKVAGNGVAVAVSEYLKYENKRCDVAVYNLDADVLSDGVKNFKFSDYNTISSLPQSFNKPDLVVFNEIYKPRFIKLYKECLKNKIPYVIIPHGSLVDGVQNRHKLKKIIGNFVYFNSYVKNADAIQFLNEKEKSESHFKYKKSIINGNGVDTSLCGDNKPTNNSLVYIGRYSVFTKGLDLIVDTCAENKEWFVNNKVDIQLYGRDSNNGLETIKQMIADKDIGDIIKLNDAVYGEDKKEVLNNAYAFIQTSRHEGQPMGIIEALAYGLPCIVTYETSFGSVVDDNKCGYGCNFDTKELFEKIKLLYDNKKQRDEMSKNAKELAINLYNWDNIMDSLLDEYKKIVGA